MTNCEANSTKQNLKIEFGICYKRTRCSVRRIYPNAIANCNNDRSITILAKKTWSNSKKKKRKTKCPARQNGNDRMTMPRSDYYANALIDAIVRQQSFLTNTRELYREKIAVIVVYLQGGINRRPSGNFLSFFNISELDLYKRR